MADADPSPKWQAFVKAYQQAPKEGYFKNAFSSPSLSGINYYNSAEAIFNALNSVKGDLSDGNKKFREALKNTVLDAPNGKFTLDENRQAIGPNFVTEVVKDEKGDPVSKVVKVVRSVGSTARLFQGGLRQDRPPRSRSAGVQEELQLASGNRQSFRPRLWSGRNALNELDGTLSMPVTFVRASESVMAARSHVAVLVVSAAKKL